MTVSLQKGNRITLEKSNGSALKNVCIGVNWGMIEKKGWFGGTNREAVDLDASVALVTGSKDVSDVVYFGDLESNCRSVIHSGDDRVGDSGGDDGLDNEVIKVDLERVPSNVDHLIVVLNSFQGHKFDTIPYAGVRIYEGTPERVDEVMATYDIANDQSFSGSTGIILARLYRHNGQWKFEAVGESTGTSQLRDTIAKAVQRL